MSRAPSIPLPRPLPPLRIPRTPGRGTTLLPPTTDEGWLSLANPIVIEYVGTNDPMYGGQAVPQGQLSRRGQNVGTRRCAVTAPNTKSYRDLRKRVAKMNDVSRLALIVYRRAYRTGYQVAKREDRLTSPNPFMSAQRYECNQIDSFCRWLDAELKRIMLSQDPSWPRKRSKTGLTRAGRRRRGPG